MRSRGKLAARLRILGFLTTLFLSPVLVRVELASQGGDALASFVTREVHGRERSRQGRSVQATGSQATAEQPSISLGMRKEAVRMRWGEPAVVRKIRTCFGAAEEWLHRGDPQRYGAHERIFHFDEDGVLTEIK